MRGLRHDQSGGVGGVIVALGVLLILGLIVLSWLHTHSFGVLP